MADEDEPKRDGDGGEPMRFEDYEVVSKRNPTIDLGLDGIRDSLRVLGKAVGEDATKRIIGDFDSMMDSVLPDAPDMSHLQKVPAMAIPVSPVVDHTRAMRESLESMRSFMGKLVDLTSKNVEIAANARQDAKRTETFARWMSIGSVGVAFASLIVALFR